MCRRAIAVDDGPVAVPAAVAALLDQQRHVVVGAEPLVTSLPGSNDCGTGGGELLRQQITSPAATPAPPDPDNRSPPLPLAGQGRRAGGVSVCVWGGGWGREAPLWLSPSALPLRRVPVGILVAYWLTLARSGSKAPSSELVSLALPGRGELGAAG